MKLSVLACYAMREVVLDGVESRKAYVFGNAIPTTSSDGVLVQIRGIKSKEKEFNGEVRGIICWDYKKLQHINGEL